MSSLTTLNAHGAYGRDYADAQAALADWEGGKDFKILRGPYFSKRDLHGLYLDGYDKIVIHNRDGLLLTTIPTK